MKHILNVKESTKNNLFTYHKTNICEIKDKMKETLLPYDTEITKNNILSIFGSLINKRVDSIQSA